MTQFAMMDPGPAGDSLISRCCRGIAHFFGFGNASRPSTQAPVEDHLASPVAGTERPALQIVSSSGRPLAPVTEMKWRRHEQLRQQTMHSLSADERQARQQAVRGLYAAHAGDLAGAEQHFANAAWHQGIDLSDIPGFWALPRSAMMTAVHAYESAGRLRDASALSARIRMQLRPRALSPVPRNVTELPSRRVSLTGNS